MKQSTVLSPPGAEGRRAYPVQIKIGLSEKGGHEYGPSLVFCCADAIESDQDGLTELEILEMARHDEHYRDNSPERFVNTVPTPDRDFVEYLPNRKWGKGVIGNLGEGIGIAILRSLMSLHPFEVHRVDETRSSMGKAPDFAVSLNERRPQTVFSVLGVRLLSLIFNRKSHDARVPDTLLQVLMNLNGSLSSFPNRFPVEAKATGKSKPKYYWSALRQLFSYWFATLDYNSEEAGYGIILLIAGIHDAPRTVEIRIFAPEDPAHFRRCLRTLKTSRAAQSKPPNITKERIKQAFSRNSTVQGGINEGYWPFI